MQGNNALYDILAALVWIQENVASFGGDRHRVTLMGHHHGAALVHLLAISPVTATAGYCKSSFRARVGGRVTVTANPSVHLSSTPVLRLKMDIISSHVCDDLIETSF